MSIIRWRRLLSVALAVVAVLGFAVAPTPAQAQTAPYAFDAITTQQERGIWKHMGLKRDRYIIFDDARIHEQGIIRNKWPFLPSQFHADLDAAAVIMEGRVWRYLFVKGNQTAYFTDAGFLSGGPPLGSMPEPFRSDMGGLSAFHLFGVPAYVATNGSQLRADDFIAGGLEPTTSQIPSVVPSPFNSDLDDISFEQEGNTVKVSLYKGFERLIYFSEINGPTFVVERVNLRTKWWFLNGFFDSTA